MVRRLRADHMAKMAIGGEVYASAYEVIKLGPDNYLARDLWGKTVAKGTAKEVVQEVNRLLADIKTLD